VHALTGLRQHLLEGSVPAKRLGHLNAVISVVMGVQFPLGDPPWGKLENARRWLAELLTQEHASL